MAIDSPAVARRGRRSDRAVVALGTLGAALVLLGVYNLVYFINRGANQVVGSPTRAQVTGTWAGDYNLPLVLRPDGTFTSTALPPHVGTAAPDVSVGGDVLGLWSAHGTWVIGPGKFNGSPESVIFTVDCGAASDGCAGHPRTFELHVETNAPNGGEGGLALFYYLGSAHDLNNQYTFIRDPGDL